MDEVVHHSVERGVATITLDSPSNRNALSRQLINELHAGIDAAEAAAARVIVLQHTGNTFCAGADLKERSSGPVDSGGMVGVLRRLSDGATVTIAAVDGAVRAGGVGLMASCDLVVVARDTTFAFTEVRIGVAPAIISVPILARVNAALLAAPFLTGETFDAADARAMGLITHISDNVAATVATLVDGVLQGAPGAVAATKALLRRVPTLSRDAAYIEMQVLSEHLFQSHEATEGIGAFRERRAPSWQVARS